MFGISNQMENARTAIYVRISANQQKTDRQAIELLDFAKRSDIEVNPEDIKAEYLGEGQVRYLNPDNDSNSSIFFLPIICALISFEILFISVQGSISTAKMYISCKNVLFR